MANYQDLVASPTYNSKVSGAAVGILFKPADDPATQVFGAVTDFNFQEGFGQNPVEEVGNDGVDEFVEDRHTGSGSASLFFTAKRSDELPSRQSFIGREFTVIRRMAPNRAQAGAVIDAFVGLKITNVSGGQAARGSMSMQISFVYTRRYTGEQWAALSGGGAS